MLKKSTAKRNISPKPHTYSYLYESTITSMEETLKILTEKIDKTSLKIDATTEKIDATIIQLNDIKKRLFIDNGTPSIQSRLTLNENTIKDLNERMSSVEEDMNLKLEDMKQMPKTYISYTVGLIMFLGTIVSGLIWLIKNI